MLPFRSAEVPPSSLPTLTSLFLCAGGFTLYDNESERSGAVFLNSRAVNNYTVLLELHRLPNCIM